MQFNSLSLVVGDNKCNAKCPWCIAKRTPAFPGTTKINEERIRYAFSLTREKPIILTGNGEPTLYPKQISEYLRLIDNYTVNRLVELHTNGSNLPDDRTLKRWLKDDLLTVAISIASVDWCTSANAMGLDGFCYYSSVRRLVDHGFNVRLNVVITDNYFGKDCGYIDGLNSIANKLGINQISLREVFDWNGYTVSDVTRGQLINQLLDNGMAIYDTDYGATYYDYDGKSFCYTNCLTPIKNGDSRQLIFWPGGQITYDWRYLGARIL